MRRLSDALAGARRLVEFGMAMMLLAVWAAADVLASTESSKAPDPAGAPVDGRLVAGVVGIVIAALVIVLPGRRPRQP